ncbi:MAG: hypothetical protein CMH81_02460 [Nitrospiraceae bacterium]|nr:hypothetical protein [Nitrospiraceae bacterium]
MKRWAVKVARWREPIMRKHGPTTRFGPGVRYGLLALTVVGMMVGPVISSVLAQVVTLTPTEGGAALGVQPGTATIDVKQNGNAKVTFDLSGIPAPNPGRECRGLDSDQSLLSGWFRFINDAGESTVNADNLVERWGPPPTIIEDAPEGCVAEYPISRGRKPFDPENPESTDRGGGTSGCYGKAPNVITWSPIAKSTAGFTAGMGGTSRPDPNGFVSDIDGDANATLKTNFDPTDGATTPLVLNPWHFGSSVPPFWAQCTNPKVTPAPPVCLAAGGKLRANDSGYKRVYENKPFNDHVGPNGERIPSRIPGIGVIGEMNTFGEVDERAYGRGLIFDINGPCDNNPLARTPCGPGGFGKEGGPPAHPAGRDMMGFPPKPGSAKGQRFQVPDEKGRQTLARAEATHISVVLHNDCLTHGHIPGHGPGIGLPPPAQGLPDDFVEILRGEIR